LLFWQLHLSPELQLLTRIVPCGSQLWAIQHAWSTGTAEVVTRAGKFAKASDKCYTQQKGMHCSLAKSLNYQVNCSIHTYLWPVLTNEWLPGCKQTGETVVTRGLLCPVHLTTTLHWQLSEHLWEDITNALQSCSKELLCCYIVQAGDSLTDALRVFSVVWL